MSLLKLRKETIKKNKGFTLVELLVVVAILAILAAALLPKFLGYTDRAREARTMADLSTMKSIVEIYAADEGQGSYPVDEEDNADYATLGIGAVLTGKGVNWSDAVGGIVDPYSNAYAYQYDVANDRYIIASPGKDGVFATADDIYVTDSDQPTMGAVDSTVFADFASGAVLNLSTSNDVPTL